MSRYARRTDKNHAEIIGYLRGLGYPVLDTHNAPGMLDMMVMTRTGRLILVEIKNPDEPAPLTKPERETLAMFSGAAFVVNEIEQVLNIIYSIDGGIE